MKKTTWAISLRELSIEKATNNFQLFYSVLDINFLTWLCFHLGCKFEVTNIHETVNEIVGFLLSIEKVDFVLSFLDLPNFSVLVFKRSVLLTRKHLYFKK